MDVEQLLENSTCKRPIYQSDISHTCCNPTWWASKARNM